ncbi:unnamed protein product [Rhizophagus irregularis]|nr:unnamed protein product [Rhizophagus irregularis]
MSNSKYPVNILLVTINTRLYSIEYSDCLVSQEELPSSEERKKNQDSFTSSKEWKRTKIRSGGLPIFEKSGTKIRLGGFPNSEKWKIKIHK